MDDYQSESSKLESLEEDVFGADGAALESSFDIEARAIVGRSDRWERRSKRSKAVKRRDMKIVQLKLKLDEVRSRLIVEQSMCADAAAELNNLNSTVRALRDENARQRGERQHEHFVARERRAQIEGDVVEGRQELGAARGEAMLLRAEVDELRQSRLEREAEFIALAKRHRAEIKAVRAEQASRAEVSLAAQKDALEAAFAESNGDDISAVMELTQRQHDEELHAVRAELAEVRREASRAAEEACRVAGERDAQMLELEAVSSAAIREAKAEAAAAVRAADEAAALALRNAKEEAAAAAQSATAKRLGGLWRHSVEAKRAQKNALETQAVEGRAAQRAALEAEHARAAALIVEHDAAAAAHEEDLVRLRDAALAQLRAAHDSEAEGTGAATSDTEALATKVAALEREHEELLRERREAAVDTAAARVAEAERLHAAVRAARAEDEVVSRRERAAAAAAQEMQSERIAESQREIEVLGAEQQREEVVRAAEAAGAREAAREAAALAAAREAVVAPTAFTMRRRPDGTGSASQSPASLGASLGAGHTVHARRRKAPGRGAERGIDGRRWAGEFIFILFTVIVHANPADNLTPPPWGPYLYSTI